MPSHALWKLTPRSTWTESRCPGLRRRGLHAEARFWVDASLGHGGRFEEHFVVTHAKLKMNIEGAEVEVLRRLNDLSCRASAQQVGGRCRQKTASKAMRWP